MPTVPIFAIKGGLNKCQYRHIFGDPGEDSQSERQIKRAKSVGAEVYKTGVNIRSHRFRLFYLPLALTISPWVPEDVSLLALVWTTSYWKFASFRCVRFEEVLRDTSAEWTHSKCLLFRLSQIQTTQPIQVPQVQVQVQQQLQQQQLQYQQQIQQLQYQQLQLQQQQQQLQQQLQQTQELQQQASQQLQTHVSDIIAISM